MNMEVQWWNRYSVAMYWKINFNKIKQGFISITSDLVIMKACKAMTSWNDNEQVGNDNEPCGLVTNERTWNAVTMAQQPMSDRESGWGWCMGTEVKNFGKDVMETCGGEYGFIWYWPKCKMCCMEVTGWINVSCAMGNTLFTMFWLFFCCCL